MKYIIIWFWPYARKVYYELFLKNNIEISLLVDLKWMKQDIDCFFSDKTVKPSGTYFLNDDLRDNLHLDPETHLFLDSFIKQYDIDWIIISTEPKAHYCYLNWAIEKWIKIIVDKPIFAINWLWNSKLANKY